MPKWHQKCMCSVLQYSNGATCIRYEPLQFICLTFAISKIRWVHEPYHSESAIVVPSCNNHGNLVSDIAKRTSMPHPLAQHWWDQIIFPVSKGIAYIQGVDFAGIISIKISVEINS